MKKQKNIHAKLSNGENEMDPKSALGAIYHPIVHKLRNSPFLHLPAIQKTIKKSIRHEHRRNRLYVDITNLHYRDNGTGIDRVTKEISVRLVNYTKKYDVVCIYNKDFSGYYAALSNEFATFSAGDIYFSLDDATYYSAKYERLYNRLIKENVQVFFFIHDLIPIRFPKLCPKKSISKQYKFFLKRIITYSGVLCNSNATYNDLCSWISENPHFKRNKSLILGHSLLGCDFSTKNTTRNPDDIQNEPENIINFLMVATVEPRKKYEQAIQAFNMLWKKRNDIRLTIVGRKGWKSEKTFSLIEQNKEYGKKLFWYNTGIPDEELAALYQTATAVIMASITEGFGLSVAEAAHFGKPLILRDIPPFREIAGENAFYFEEFEASDLAVAIEKWIKLYKQVDKWGGASVSAKIKLRTWDDCAKDIYTLLTGEQA